MTDVAAAIIDLYEMPTDAYDVLNRISPNHDLCRFYRMAWDNEAGIIMKRKIYDRFSGGEKISWGEAIVRFAQAMHDATVPLKGANTI